ncbi:MULTISPECIES: hypothetical protein [Atopobium]|mgnify:CR=1 FL=1|uniref:Uncharacterized protein n=1 Tax=Atopobium minutum 10063974 TaxID=997872 RepID=N2BR15_9ACTN|nr:MULTISPECIES: hypothetical protein [Atopobium]EMZ42716.1 hypothetical protein HMPREF1091_00274 [Atopobium minutum 10063974]
MDETKTDKLTDEQLVELMSTQDVHDEDDVAAVEEVIYEQN